MPNSIQDTLEFLTFKQSSQSGQSLRDAHKARVIGSTGRYYSLGEYDWHPEIFSADKGEILKIEPDLIKTTTPKIRVREFEPELFLTAFVDTLKAFWDIGRQLGSTSNFQDLTTAVSEKISRAIDYLGEPDTPEKAIDTITEKVYTRLIGGLYTEGGYEIPYLDNECKYLTGSGSAGWTGRTLSDAILKGLSNVGEFLNLDINLAGRPIYSQKDNGPTGPTISTEFYLYNYNLDALKRNVAFLYSFISGSYWIQTHIIVRSSNLYNIYMPGKTNYYFCTLDTEVSTVGKMRRIQNTGGSRLLENIIRNTGHEAGALFPDAYKIKADFSSLLPNNFNALMGSIEGRLGKPFGTSNAYDKSYFNEFLAYLNEGQVTNIPQGPTNSNIANIA